MECNLPVENLSLIRLQGIMKAAKICFNQKNLKMLSSQTKQIFLKVKSSHLKPLQVVASSTCKHVPCREGCACCRKFSTMTFVSNEKKEETAEPADHRASNRVQDILNSGQLSIIVPPVSIAEGGIDFKNLSPEHLQEIRGNQRIKKAIFNIPSEADKASNNKSGRVSDLSQKESEYIEEMQIEQDKERSLLKEMLGKEGVDENLKNSIQAILDVEKKLKKQSGQQRTLKKLREAKLQGIEDVKSVLSQAKSEEAAISQSEEQSNAISTSEHLSKSIYDPGYNLEDRWKNIRSKYTEEEYKRSATFREITRYLAAFAVASFVCLGLAFPGFKKYILGIGQTPKKQALKE